MIKLVTKRKPRVVRWTTADGRSLPINHMETIHIQNTMMWLYRQETDCVKYQLGSYHINGRHVLDWMTIFRNELKRRQVL